MLDGIESAVVKYADRAFSYAVCFMLLWMFHSTLKQLNTSLTDFSSTLKEFGVLLRERLK